MHLTAELCFRVAGQLLWSLRYCQLDSYQTASCNESYSNDLGCKQEARFSYVCKVSPFFFSMLMKCYYLCYILAIPLLQYSIRSLDGQCHREGNIFDCKIFILQTQNEKTRSIDLDMTLLLVNKKLFQCFSQYSVHTEISRLLVRCRSSPTQPMSSTIRLSCT